MEQGNRFTGWHDVDLSEKGREEARKGGQTLKKEGYVFDVAFTSVLKRAIRTLWTVLDEMDLMWIPVNRTWRLNERHYGNLTGEQGGNRRPARRGTGQDLAAQLRYSAPAAGSDRPAFPQQRSALRRSRSARVAGHRKPQDYHRAGAALLARHHRAHHSAPASVW